VRTSLDHCIYIIRPSFRMVRHDTRGPKLCRAICGAHLPDDDDDELVSRRRSLDTLQVHQDSRGVSWAQTLQRLSKGLLAKAPKTDKGTDTFMVGRFTQSKQLTLVYQDAVTGKHNSAEFLTLGDAPFDLGVEELCGCTSLVAVSHEAIWFTHF